MGLFRTGLEIHYKLFSQRGTDIFSAADDLADRLNEFGRCALFGEVSGCAGPEDAHGVLILRMHAEYEDGKPGQFRVQLLQDVETASFRHREVEQYDITVRSCMTLTASCPSPASPVTAIPGFSAMIRFNPSRTTA